MESVYFIDATTGWAVGLDGIILHTDDGGKTWVEQYNKPLTVFNAVHFIDRNVGWVVGLGGRILHSTDGGYTWVQQPSGTSDVLTSTQFFDETTGWIVGLGGTILRYTELDYREEHKVQPEIIELHQNYPNPFNAITTIAFTIWGTHPVTLRIYDMLGRKVATLLNETLTPGSYAIPWNAQGLAAGTYIYRLQAGNFVESRKLIYLK